MKSQDGSVLQHHPDTFKKGNWSDQWLLIHTTATSPNTPLGLSKGFLALKTAVFTARTKKTVDLVCFWFFFNFPFWQLLLWDKLINLWQPTSPCGTLSPHWHPLPAPGSTTYLLSNLDERTGEGWEVGGAVSDDGPSWWTEVLTPLLGWER